MMVVVFYITDTPMLIYILFGLLKKLFHRKKTSYKGLLAQQHRLLHMGCRQLLS